MKKKPTSPKVTKTSKPVKKTSPIKITADRIIDLPVKELEKLNISTISCYVNMGGESYDDMINISPDEIFAHLKKTGELAKTAAKSPDAYYNFFKQFTDKGLPIIHFAASSGTSLICSCAKMAAERLPNVYVVDTLSLSGGLALLAGYAMELIKKGQTDPKIIYELCLEKREKLQSSFVIETLECLHKGGRCSSLQYLAARILKIKPVISLDKVTGKMSPREKHLGGYRGVLAKYIKSTFEKFPNPDLRFLYITHYCKDEALINYFLDTVATHHKFEKVVVNLTGCNCAIHCGPNSFGMFYFQQ